jgi:hypothetical protein
MMNKYRFVQFSSMALALLAGLLVSSSASAKEHKVKSSSNQAHVVAHISFTGLSAVNMTMQKHSDDQYYLYVQHAKNEGISIVDIGEPARPKAIGVIPALSGRMDLTGNLAIIAETQVLPISNSISQDDLVFWDLSNPTAPRVVQKFSGVVKWLEDERNFVYVLNGDGLWVISEPEERQAESTTAPTVPLYE